MRLWVVAALLGLAWPASADTVPTAPELWGKLRANMKDPASSYYRSATYVELHKGGKLISISLCGEVNSKNSYGGYTGFQPFFVNWPGPNDDVWIESGEMAVILMPNLCGTKPADGVAPKIEPLPDMAQPQ